VTEISFSDFQVDVGQLADAGPAIRGYAAAIASDWGTINTILQGIPGSAWSSPAGTSVEPVRKDCDDYFGALASVLEEIANRMDVAAQNYLVVEQNAHATFTST
jgi:hypothetical protein